MTSLSKRIVYAFPHAGAGPAIYRPWCNRFNDGGNIIFSPVGIPGRDRLSQEKVIDDLAELVDRICEDIYADFSQRKKVGIKEFATFGHSFGGVMSFIVSHELAERYGIIPHFSVISGSVAPCIQPQDDRHLWCDDRIMEKMRSDNGTPASILREPAIARRLVTALRTDYILRQQFLAYQNTKVTQPLWVVSAKKDEHVILESQFAWKNHTYSSVEITEIEGGHFSVYENFDIISRLLTRSSDEYCRPLITEIH